MFNFMGGFAIYMYGSLKNKFLKYFIQGKKN